MDRYNEILMRNRKVELINKYGLSKKAFLLTHDQAPNNAGRVGIIKEENRSLLIQYGVPEGKEPWVTVECGSTRTYASGKTMAGEETVSIRGRKEIEAMRDYLNMVLDEIDAT